MHRGAPFGNQNAKGCKTSGRPPLYDYAAEGKALEEWSKRDTSINLCEFAVERDICPDYINRWEKCSEEFAESLRKAKCRLAIRREKMVNEETLNYGAWARNAAAYDFFLHQFERSEKEYEAYLKKESSQVNINPETVSKFNELMTMLQSLQSDRKIAETKSSTEYKS